LQAWHVGQVLVRQHVPSTQNPDAHSALTMHMSPAPFLPPHTLFTHRTPDTQSFGPPQLRGQVLPPAQRKGAHETVAGLGATQLPLPSHAFACVNVDWPLAHEAAAHTVPLAYFWQPPLPSHNPSVPQLAAPLSGHRPSGVLFASGLHVPTLP
jgi:hypothetical protein